MRIAMVGPFGFHPNKTMQSRAFYMARPMVQRGHQVRIFMPPWQTPEEADKSWQAGGVELRYTPLGGGGIVGITRTLIRETLAWRPDVVHGFKPKAYSGLAMWWLWHFRRSKIRLVLDTDDWEGWGGWNELAPYTMLQKQFFAWQEKWGLKHCHQVTVASRTLESLVWGLGVRPEKVRYVPNGPGIDAADPGAANMPIKERLGTRPTLLLYSRLFEFETERLVAVLKGVRNAVPDLAIMVVGASLYDRDETRFSQQAHEAGLDESFVEIGWVEQAQVPGILAAADVGLYLMEDTLLNRTKCPLKLVDMLYVGVPVVAERVGQVSEYVVHRQTGLLRASGDVNGLIEDVVDVLQDKSAKKQLSIGARQHIHENFNWQRLSLLVEHAYLGGSDQGMGEES